MIRKLIVPGSIVVALLCISSILTPKALRAGEDWLPVSAEDLAMKDNPKSPGAHAMILNRELFIDAKQSYQTEYVRIKIFTEEGKDQGDIEIPYDRKQSKVQDIRARTIRPDGSIVNFKGEVYDKELVKSNGVKILAKTFSLPEITPGCIIEYKYHQQFDTDRYWNIEWVVQGSLFTREARFATKPSDSSYAPNLYWREFMVPGNSKPEKQKDGSFAMEVRDLPGITEEDLMPPENAMRARVAFYYKSLEEPQNETSEQYWRRMGKKWNEGMEKFIDKKGALQGAVAQAVGASDPPEVKVQKLYERVQEIHNTTWDVEKTVKEEKREKQKENNNVEDVLKRGYGNALEVSYLMVGLARAAGFDSSMVWVAPRNNNSFYPDMQDQMQLSAFIVWIRANNKDLYVDPASKFYPYGILPWYETGVSGLRVNKQGGDMVSVPLADPKDAVRERLAEMHYDEDGTLSGKLTINYQRAWGAEWRESEREEDEAGRLKTMQDQIKGWLPNEATIHIEKMMGWEKTSEPLQIEASVKIPGFATPAGHRILVPVTFFAPAQPSYFRHEKRINSIYFHYPYTEKDSLSIQFPPVLKIESVPAETKNSPGAGFLYDVTATQNAGTVKIDRQLVIGGILFPVSAYPALRQFFSRVKTADDSQIVLGMGQTSQAR
jgi:uncharacterized protein DUF3857/transglutaminase superfamily protein